MIASAASLAVAILLLTAKQATAQTRIGPVTVRIPKLPKLPRGEKPAVAEAPAEKSETKSDERGPRPTRPAGVPESTSESSTIGNPSRPQSDARLEILLEEVSKRKKEVDTYNPSERSRFITMSSPELFLPAISMRARAAYYKRDQLNARQQAALNPALDSLAAAAAQKLPLYKPEAMVFAFHNPGAELMMKQSLKNLATLKVHRSGIKEATWLIEKNEFGLPLDRYRHGYIWARDSSDDHPYCQLYTIYVQQNYAGGGAYGEVFAHLSDSEIVGCP